MTVKHAGMKKRWSATKFCGNAQMEKTLYGTLATPLAGLLCIQYCSSWMPVPPVLHMLMSTLARSIKMIQAFDRLLAAYLDFSAAWMLIPSLAANPTCDCSICLFRLPVADV